MENQNQYHFRNHFWDQFFKLDNKSFKRNGYKFAFMIKTDRISCSIILSKTDENGKFIEKPNKLILKEETK